MWETGKTEKQGKTVIEYNLGKDSQGLCSTYDSGCPVAVVFS